MQLPNLDPSLSADALYGDILAYVDQASAMVEARDTVSLVGLDSAVDALCARILALNPDPARDDGKKLEHLLARIDALQANMRALQAEVAASINAAGTQKKASRAYNNAPTGKVEE